MLELVYTGEQAASPERIGIFLPESGTPDDLEPIFEEYEELTEGDSTVVEDVDSDDHAEVLLDVADSGYRPIAHISAEPQRSFTFEDRDGELVAIYREQVQRDAQEFRILADGEETDVQLSEGHNVLRPDDEIKLGTFEVGTEIVVEWVAPDEPTEVDTHDVVPAADFKIEGDADSESITVTHVGGDTIDADDLGIVIEPVVHEPTGWDGHNEVSEGDATTIELEEEEDAYVLLVVYREREIIYDEPLQE